MSYYTKIFDLTIKANVCREVAGEMYRLMGSKEVPEECGEALRKVAEAKTKEAEKLDAQIKKLL